MRFHLLPISTLLLATSALASDGIFLTKTLTMPPATPGEQEYYQCRLDPDHAEIVRQNGPLTTTEQYPIEVKGDLAGLVEQASQGKISTQPGKADVPSLSYVAIITGQNSTRYVDLFATGNIETQNDSRAARILIRFIETNCRN